MNRRVLATLLTLADVHTVKETDGVTPQQSDDAYGRHGVALCEVLRDESDSALYHRLAKLLCAATETIHYDPEGAALLEQARKRELPTRAKQ